MMSGHITARTIDIDGAYVTIIKNACINVIDMSSLNVSDDYIQTPQIR
jgi:hypothetical protein